jgi:predicted permease
MRSGWSFRTIDTLAQDLRFASRVLRRTPVFTAAAVLSLAAGIGASAAVFNVADAVLFRPLAARAPQELRSFRIVQTLGAATKVADGVDAGTFREIQRTARFATFAGYRLLEDVNVVVHAGSAPAPVRAELVSSNYFSLLGVGASAGRLIGEEDGATGVVPAVISERFWRAAFNRDPAVVGRVIALKGVRVEIAGVTRSFRGMVADRPADVFLPSTAARAVEGFPSAASIQLVVRLASGISVAEAEQRMAVLHAAVSPKRIPGAVVRVELPSARLGASETRGSLARPLGLGLALVAILLLVASANTGGLLLARFASRRGEFGVRLAIGAGRARLVRQLLVEALMLAAMAAAAGLVVAAVAGPLLVLSIPSSEPLDYELRFDWRLMAFTAAISVSAGTAAAGASLFRLLRSDPAAMLAGNLRTVAGSQRRLAGVLIAAQVACSLLLLVGATGLTRTLMNLRNVPAGFNAHDTFSVDFSLAGRPGDPAQNQEYLLRLHERVATAPFVAAATFAQFRLMASAATTGTVEVAGFAPSGDEDRWVRMYFVGPKYFETLGMPLLLGRDLNAADRSGRERVAVVNQRFATFYFGTASAAIGRTINRNIRIVGIAADARYDTLRDQPPRVMFVPYAQAPPRSAMTLLVRSAGDRQAAMRAVLEAIHAYDPGLKTTVTTGDNWVAATLSRERFVASIALTISVLTVFLACTGLYAAVSNAVAQRRGELAVRLALGATPADVIRLVIQDPIRTTLLGIAAGVPAAYVLMRAAASLLFEVPPFDVSAITLCGMALVLVAALAALGPAVRAARIDPIRALRTS